MREQVLVLYLAGLLEGQGAQLQLVPRYLPLLREGNRELLAHEMLQVRGGGEGGGEGECRLTLVNPYHCTSPTHTVPPLALPLTQLLTQRLIGAGSGAWAHEDAACCQVYCSMAAWFQVWRVWRGVKYRRAAAAGGEGAVWGRAGLPSDLKLVEGGRRAGGERLGQARQAPPLLMWAPSCC